MDTDFQILTHRRLTSGATLNQAKSADVRSISLSLEDNASVVLTDFKHTQPFSTTSTATLKEINDNMIAGGVRLLFIADSDGTLQGLITYTDIFGEKPVRYITEHGGSREDILAQDIMTPVDRLEALEREDIKNAKVGDIVETVKTAGRQHILVVDTGEDGRQIISGIFSSTSLAKLLGIKIELSARANTFADLVGRALS
jgi:CBS domain containing-hemolysin-like protein